MPVGDGDAVGLAESSDDFLAGCYACKLREKVFQRIACLQPSSEHSPGELD
jgi:hypothetical protein